MKRQSHGNRQVHERAANSGHRLPAKRISRTSSAPDWLPDLPIKKFADNATVTHSTSGLW